MTTARGMIAVAAATVLLALAGCAASVGGQAAELPTAELPTAELPTAELPTAGFPTSAPAIPTPSAVIDQSGPQSIPVRSAEASTTASSTTSTTTASSTTGSADPAPSGPSSTAPNLTPMSGPAITRVTPVPPTAPPTVRPTVTVVVTAPPTATPRPPSTPAPVTRTVPRSTVVVTVTSTGPPAQAGQSVTIDHFQSPSGNIACQIDSTGIRCDALEITFTAPRPASCDQGVPKAISLPTGQAARFICISDTVADPNLPVLEYGQTTRAHGFTCSSREDGMQCSDDGTGNSFRLARGSYDL